MTLDQVQDLFAALATGEAVDPDARDACLSGTAELCAEERARVYADMYSSRLTDALREDYPLLARLVGDGEFFAIARAYVRLHPSRSPSLARLGGALPGFLRDRPSPRPDLADLAALEWARAEAFIAADAVPEDIAALEAVGGALPGARLELVPSVRLVSLRHDAAGLWGELEAQREPPSPVQSAGSLLVWRNGFQVFHAPIGQEELAALSTVQRGAPLGEACEAFAGLADPAKAALEALSSWFGEGLVARVVA